MHKKFKNAILASHYTEEKEKIDVLIETIKEKIALVDPLTLFNFLTSMNMMMLVSQNPTSELEISDDVNFQLRCVEYVQSLLVSMDHNKDNEINHDEQELICHEILNYCIELYRKTLLFYTFWVAYQQENGNLNLEDEEYIVFAQMMSQVRGEQYQVFRIPILKELLQIMF